MPPAKGISLSKRRGGIIANKQRHPLLTSQCWKGQSWQSLLCSRMAGPNPAMPDRKSSCLVPLSQMPPCPSCPLSAPQARGVLAPAGGTGELAGRRQPGSPGTALGLSQLPGHPRGQRLEPTLPQHTRPLSFGRGSAQQHIRQHACAAGCCSKH